MFGGATWDVVIQVGSVTLVNLRYTLADRSLVVWAWQYLTSVGSAGRITPFGCYRDRTYLIEFPPVPMGVDFMLPCIATENRVNRNQRGAIARGSEAHRDNDVQASIYIVSRRL